MITCKCGYQTNGVYDMGVHECMTEKERVLSTEYSEKFDELRKNRMVVSHYKYGGIKENYDKKNGMFVDMHKTIELRWKKYLETGNTEYLADLANFCMIEFMYPQHSNAHFEATDSDKSPGLVGMSIKEIERFVEQEG